MKDFRNYSISAIKRILKSESQDDGADDGADDAGYDAWLETGDDDYLYNDRYDDIDDLRSDAYKNYLDTGDDAYLYGNNYPKGSREHRVWAEVYQPYLYKDEQTQTQTKNYSATFNNQNNAGNNQYENPDKTLTKVSNALNTTAPVNGSFSTSNMEQNKLQRTTSDFNNVTSNANPTGENGKDSKKEKTPSIKIQQIEITKVSPEEKILPNDDVKQGVVLSIKKQLQSLGKKFETKSLEVAEDGYIEEDENQLPLASEKEREIEQFFQPDPMVEKMDQKSVKIKHLLKSLNSFSEEEAVFKDIKNATKYAKIYNTKIASHNEKAYVVTPTLKDINTFGKRIFKVDIKKY